MGKAFVKQTKTIGEKQAHALKSLGSSDKQLPSTKDFISKQRLNPEIANEIEKNEEEERKADRNKMFYEGSNKPMILENLKQYVFLVRKLEIILLI